jgi:hypothetical protein
MQRCVALVFSLVAACTFADGTREAPPKPLSEARPEFEYVYLPLLHDFKHETMKVLLVGHVEDAQLWRAFLPNSQIETAKELKGCRGGTAFDVAVVQHMRFDGAALPKKDIAAARALLGGEAARRGGVCTVQPGGLIIMAQLEAMTIGWLLKLPEVMNRGFFDPSHRVLDNEGDLHVKTVTITRPVRQMRSSAGIIGLKSLSDDVEYMVLGEHGKKFVDGENGVVMRSLYRQIYHVSTTLRARAISVMNLHSAHIRTLNLHLKFKPGAAKPQNRVKTAAGTKSVLKSMAQGLAIHEGRLSVARAEKQDLVVEVKPPEGMSYGETELTFPPNVPWNNGSEYFGRKTALSSLAVVGLTVAEKMKLVDNDLWRGDITKYLLPDETEVEIVLESGDCKDLMAPHVRCVVKPSDSGSSPKGSELSVLHQIHAPSANDQLHSSPFQIVDTGRGKPWLWSHIFPTATMTNIRPAEESDFDMDDDDMADDAYHEQYDGVQTDDHFMEATVKHIGPIDFVGDDNGNPPDRQVGAFTHLIGNLRPGASYAIHDLETSYKAGIGELPDGAMAFFRKVASEMAPDKSVELGSMQFSRNVVVVTKAGRWHQAGIRAYGHTHPSKQAHEDL